MCKIQKFMTIYLTYLCSIVRCMKTPFTFLFLLISAIVFAQPAKMSSDQYIVKYKDIAIAELYRSGVPASITLAQGILESQNGNSRLAREANNHFGIKCKSTWTGKTIIADDDAVGECFRAYESVQESYKDHSNFLRENWRYSECFKLERTDYSSWADGLKKAGYATNPKYNTLITGLIERYNLHQYDLAPMPAGVVPEFEVKNNNIPLIYAQEGESINGIAQKNDIDSKLIYRYNDLPKGTAIEPGDMVYLKPKKRKGSEPYHIVQEGENIHDLSQIYGIKLKQLYKKNKIEPGEEVAVGTILYLQKKRDDKPVTISKEELERQEKEKKDAAENEKKIKETEAKNALEKEAAAEEKIINSGYYTLKAGDNLYRISEKYHVFMEDLLEWNGIVSTDGLKVGDKIYLTKEAAAKAGLAKNTDPKKEREKAETKAKVHTVVKGETAYRICKTYGINTSQLMDWNGLKSVESIREGQKLKVGE